MEYHLGANFDHDEQGTLCMSPKKYIDRMMSNYERYFGKKASTNVLSPLEHGDHPELDDSDLLDEEGIQLYQSLVGSLQWAISLGCFDIACAVMTMSCFRAAPQQGHLFCLCRNYRYLLKFKDAKIRFCTHQPDYSDVPYVSQDWKSISGAVKEAEPPNAPPPLGKRVTLTHYVDANTSS